MEDTLDKQEDSQPDDLATEQAVETEPDTPEPVEAKADAPCPLPAESDGDLDDADVDADEDATDPVAAAAEREMAATVEAILFSTDNPLSPAKIAQVAEMPGRREVKKAIRQLNRRYEQTGSSFRIESIAGGYQMLTQPEYHDVVSRLFKTKSDSKLSQAAMETLAIIAYRQPVLRADIEAVRGVASGEMIRNLMDKNLVKIVGRAEVLGRPMLYGTTRRFLEVFGLSGIDDLPKVEQLAVGRDDKTKPSAPAEAKAAEADAPAEITHAAESVEALVDAGTPSTPAEPDSQ